jgi:FdhE protein
MSQMTSTSRALADLSRRRTEWAPWLAVVAEVVREAGAPEWDAAVPFDGAAPDTVKPLLAGAALGVPARSVRRFLERLFRIASQGGSAKMATVHRSVAEDLDVLRLFAASVCQDSGSIAAAAAASGSDAEAFQAVVALLAVPFLHACARRFASSISPSWVHGYCPVCGSWPAFVEVRGIERSRSFRCGRCAAEWHARALCCPYCGTVDHDELVALVPEKTDLNAAIDACNLCRGYVKSFTRLQGCPAATVMLEDLASVELDVAALQQGYTRPPDAGYALAISASDRAALRRPFWRTS